MNENEIVRILLSQRIRLSATIWAVVRDTHATEDLFQELVIRAMDERSRFACAEELAGWAKLAARHRAIDYVRVRDGRSRILEAKVLELLAKQMESQPDELLDSRLDAIRECVSQMPAQTRKLVSMRYHEAMPGAEIAQKLDRTRDAVYQSLCRLHRALRKCVEEKLHRAGRFSEGSP
ncbi:MAG: sigma-70 family RNA polymerase sigma factor [Planctomycetota bacterium]